MKVLLSLFAVAGAMQVEDPISHGKADSIRESFRKVAERVKKAGRIDQNEVDTINSMLAEIDTVLMAALTAERASELNILDNAIMTLNKCTSDNWGTDAEHGLARILIEEQQGAQTAGADNAHSSCRNVDEKAAYDEYVEACRLADEYVTGTLAVQLCPNRPPFEEDSEVVFNYMTCEREFVGAHYEHYKHLHNTCKHHREVLWPEQVDACNREQNLFRNAKCHEHDVQVMTCSVYDECWDQQSSLLAATRSNAETVENTLRLQRHALEIIHCYGDEILKATTGDDGLPLDGGSPTIDVSRCEDLQCTHCDELDIHPLGTAGASGTEPAKQACTPDADIPCTPAWIHYIEGQILHIEDTPLQVCSGNCDGSLYVAPH